MKDFKTQIDEILQKVSIIDVINNYVELKKSGKNYFGLCPFHDDTNPSMSVSEDKKIFKCFSCGETGNAITFVQKIENISFMQALQKVAKTVGIDINVSKNPQEQVNRKYYQIMHKATEFYKFVLHNAKDGQNALKYLYERKLNNDIINRFNIGLSLNENNLLYQALTKEGFLPVDLIELGLIKSNKDSYYDVFRNRIMFPIEDLNGNVVGFSGRIYQDGDQQHKYVNSPESVIFKKSQILYNYHRAATEIRKKDLVFLFEGFMDVIAAYRANVTNAIASMGTALTIDQAKAIQKLTKNVVICYDGDEAGIEATKRAIDILASINLSVKVCTLPEGLDPDDYINKYGAQKLNEFLNNNQISSIDFLYLIEQRRLSLDDPTSIELFKRNVFRFLSKLNSNVLIEIYLNKMSTDLGVSFESLQNDFKKNRIYFQPTEPFIPKHTPKRFKLKERNTKYLLAEKFLIIMAYQNKEACREIINSLDNHYVDRNQRELLFKVNDYYYKYDVMDHEIFSKMLSESQLELITDILKNGLDEIYNLTIPELVSEVKDYKTKRHIYEEHKQALIQEDDLDEQDLLRFSKIKSSLIKFVKSGQNKN